MIGVGVGSAIALWIVLFLILILIFVSRTHIEGFADPMPHEIFKTLRGLLDKYDRPEIWNHAVQVANKSPTELARAQLTLDQAI